MESWMATVLAVTAYSSQLLYWTAVFSAGGSWDGSCAGCDSLFFAAAVLNSRLFCRWILGWQLCWLWQLILHSCCIEQPSFLQVDPGMAAVLAVTAYSLQLLYWTAVFSAGGSCTLFPTGSCTCPISMDWIYLTTNQICVADLRHYDHCQKI
jgi:hypothetical protein